MSNQLIDTVVQLRQCPRCKAYVFVCMVSGIKTAADPKPLNVEEYRAALISGRMTYDQLDQAGRPWKLQGRTAASQWPPFKGRKIVAEHGCTKAMNMAEAEFIDIPRSTPASGIGAAGVTTGQYASTSTQTTLGTVAVNVIPHRSRTYLQVKCDRCKLSIGHDWNFWGIQRGEEWVHAEHGYECC
jgi:hypothetical protein